jgi:hypothetical protein
MSYLTTISKIHHFWDTLFDYWILTLLFLLITPIGPTEKLVAPGVVDTSNQFFTTLKTDRETKYPKL